MPAVAGPRLSLAHSAAADAAVLLDGALDLITQCGMPVGTYHGDAAFALLERAEKLILGVLSCLGDPADEVRDIAQRTYSRRHRGVHEVQQ